MEESKRQLKLLGVLVNPDLNGGSVIWATCRGGYYIHVTYLEQHLGATYRFATGLHGNTSAFSKNGHGTSLDDCVLMAHLEIAKYLREVESVHEFIRCVESPPEVSSRYNRKSVI
jgi:hypothetical protein